MRKATYLKPRPANWESLCKRELAEIRLPDITFDYALPQVWLDNYVAMATSDPELRERLYEAIICYCVTAYPPGNYFGEIVNLTNGDIVNSI